MKQILKSFSYDFNDPSGITSWGPGDTADFITWEQDMKVEVGEQIVLVDHAESMACLVTVTNVYPSPYVEGAWVIDTDYRT